MSVPVEITKKMGQSIINQGDTCLKRLEYMFYHDTPNRGGVNLAIGTGYHAGDAQYYLDRLAGLITTPNSGDVERYVDVAITAFTRSITWDDYTNEPVDIFDWRYQPSTYRAPEIMLDYDEAVLIVADLVRAYFEGGHFWDPAQYQVVSVEQTLDLPYPGLDGWRRGGTADLILADMNTADFNGSQYIIVDQKTARKKWAKNKGNPTNPQAAWYIASWRDWSGSDDVTFVYDVMAINLDPETKRPEPTFERRAEPRNERHIQMTLERGRDMARLIEQGGPFPASPDSFLCSEAYCDYWDPCPYGKVLNFYEEAA